MVQATATLNLGTKVCYHSKYKLGDWQFIPDHYASWEDLLWSLEQTKGARVALPLYLYDHGGISVYTEGDTRHRQYESWDSTQIGFIYCTTEDIRNRFGVVNMKTMEMALELLKEEVLAYSGKLERGDDD